MFKLTRLKPSSVWTLWASRMIKSLQSHLGRDATSGSAAASRTFSPAREGEKSTSRTLIITPPPRRGHPKAARSTRSAPDRTCAGARSSFTTCQASLCSHWCLTSTHLPGALTVTMGPGDPSWRRLITGSSCQEDSVTLYRWPPSCPAPRPFILLLLQAAPTTTTALLPPARTPQCCQVSRRMS